MAAGWMWVRVVKNGSTDTQMNVGGGAARPSPPTLQNQLLPVSFCISNYRCLALSLRLLLLLLLLLSTSPATPCIPLPSHVKSGCGLEAGTWLVVVVVKVVVVVVMVVVMKAVVVVVVVVMKVVVVVVVVVMMMKKVVVVVVVEVAARDLSETFYIVTSDLV